MGDYQDAFEKLFPYHCKSIIKEREEKEKKEKERLQTKTTSELISEIIELKKENTNLKKENIELEEDANNFTTIMRDEVLNELERQRNRAQDDLKELQKNNIDISVGQYDIWKLIKCKPTDSNYVIKKEVRKLLQLYHPDKFINSGPLVYKMVSRLTKQILEFQRKYIK
jgi:predicted RNase H-like nuclease (RuvC/YqgF family)